MAQVHKSPISGAGSPRASTEKSQMVSHLESTNDQENVTFVVSGTADSLHRDLSNRKVQLVAVGSSIGTALFLSIGGVLNKTGPGSLFLGFAVYNIFLAFANNCMAEMTTYMPVSGNFIRMAGQWVDDAVGFCAGWNFFLYTVIIVPFEITALSLVLSYWSEDLPVAAICGGCIVLYFLINVFAVSIYGEAEFWLTSGKVGLLVMLLLFTFITMVGGNPKHDAYGFRYWKNPGAFAEYSSTGNLGRFEGFLTALWSASFTCVGPEYVGMIAAEAKHPRTYIKTAYKIVFLRLVIFFLGGSLAVGILVPYNNDVLNAVYRDGTASSGSAAASPYIIAMQNLGISGLPHLVTALISTTIFSAGNCNVFCATRSLYGLAVDGRAPKFLTKCTKKGIPIYCILVVMIFPCLSFLQLSNSSATVLNWLINLATSATVITYIIICVTYICFYRACKAQGFDRSKLPYYGRFQPWSGYLCLGMEIIIMIFNGYKSLVPFDAASFLTAYTMPILMGILFVGWKLIKGTKWRAPEEVDLVWEAPAITAYEEALSIDEPPIGFLRDCYLAVRAVVKRAKPKKSEA